MPTTGPKFRGQTRERFAQAFTDGAATYAAVRPSYPAEAIDLLLGDISPEDGPIVEFGAGTGQLTRKLLDRGFTVIATEPSEAMADQLSQYCGEHPNLSVKCAAAENTQLATGRASAVVAAQAWHWFDPEIATAEAARIGSQQAALGLIWNQLDVTVPWVHRLSRIMHAGDVHGIDWRPPITPGHFIPGELQHVYWNQVLTPEQVVELTRTRTYWLQAKETTRAKVEQNVRWYLLEELGFAADQPIEIPYRCTVLRNRKLGE